MPNFCLKCGAKLDEDSAFCMMCGAKIKEKTIPQVEDKKPKKQAEEKKPIPKTEEKKPQAPIKHEPAPVIAPTQPAQQQTYLKEKKPKTGLIIGIAATIVVIVVVLAVLLFFLFQGSINGGEGVGLSDTIKFYGTWDTSLAIPFIFNSDTSWDIELPLLGSTQVGYWTIKDNKIHLTASLSEDWSYLSGAYEYDFSSDGNTCTLTSTATSYFVITLTR